MSNWNLHPWACTCGANTCASACPRCGTTRMAAAVEKDASDVEPAKVPETRIAARQRVLDEKKRAYDRHQRRIQRQYKPGDDGHLFTSTMPNNEGE